jgi:hypothetical protein
MPNQNGQINQQMFGKNPHLKSTGVSDLLHQKSTLQEASG